MQLAPILAIFMSFLVPLLAICMVMFNAYLNYKKRKEMFALYHQERMAAIDKGIELPPLSDEFFRENDGRSRRSPHRPLLAGLILLFVGVTVSIALHLTGVRTDAGGDAALFGLIPVGLGAAFLIYYFMVGRKLAAAMEEERKAALDEKIRGQRVPSATR